MSNNLHPYDQSNRHPIQSMLDDTTTQVSPLAYAAREPESVAPWIAGTVVSGSFGAIGILSCVAVQAITVTGVGLLIIGAIGAVFCNAKTSDIRQRNEHRRREDEQNRLHLQALEMKRMDQRTPAMQTAGNLEATRMTTIGQMEVAKTNAYAQTEVARTTSDAQVKVAKSQAEAQVGVARAEAEVRAADRQHETNTIVLKHNLESEAAREVRDWQAKEAALDRQATVEQMLVRFEGKLNELQVRMEFESPSAAKRTEEQLIIMRGTVTQLKEINEITDSTVRKQMFDRFKAGFK